MFNISPNPYRDPIIKFLNEFKNISWYFPYLTQTANLVITSIILLVLIILYLTVGFISQVSLTFWELIVEIGDKMKYSQPIESTAYALAATIYFIVFLPFFILQSPIWLFGWIVRKLGIRILAAIILIYFSLLLIQSLAPDWSTSVDTFVKFRKDVKEQFFSSDTTSKSIEILSETAQSKKK